MKRAERENIDPNGTITDKYSPAQSASNPSVQAVTPTGLDEETKQIIHQMKAEKRQAEEKEDFDLAAAFKVTIEVLTTLGEQIWMCDHEKQRCVQVLPKGAPGRTITTVEPTREVERPRTTF